MHSDASHNIYSDFARSSSGRPPGAISSINARFRTTGVVLPQRENPIAITRLYTGADNQTRVEEVELKFTPGKPAEVAS
jgi:hypothetical protein